MSENIRVGIIGAGGNTTLKHIPLLQKIDGVEIVSVANIFGEAVNRVHNGESVSALFEF